MRITVAHQVLGGKLEKSVIFDDPERTSLAPEPPTVAAKKTTAAATPPKPADYEITVVPAAPEFSDGKRGRSAGKAQKEVTDG